ncbi:hypothetical protein HBB16_04700 [Pseudonocardia sp. MCCB 268]|nr:hypothetical protein [Pseudonocardia cytotoxica]
MLLSRLGGGTARPLHRGGLRDQELGDGLAPGVAAAHRVLHRSGRHGGRGPRGGRVVAFAACTRCSPGAATGSRLPRSRRRRPDGLYRR